MDPEIFMEAMDVAMAVIEQTDNTFVVPHELKKGSSPYPVISMKGNEWMVKAFHDTARASLDEIISVFDGGDLEQMRSFWVAEHATQAGHCGGGLQYLAARTFQNAEGGVIDRVKTPEYPEARWQFENFLLYDSMNDKQRQRYGRINESIMGLFQQQAGTFFRHTHIPSYKEQSRIYGKSGKQSFWNNLPIPPVEDIGGVAYVSPLNIVRFLFANGIPVDDILVQFHDQEKLNNLKEAPDEPVFNVCESRRAKYWIRSIVEESEKGDVIPSSMKRCIASWTTTWKDGFGHSRVKNFRGSTIAQTLTCSPPKHLVNAGNNTFLNACGLKHAKGWSEVQYRFERDMAVLSDTLRPVLVYHGVLQKIIPVFFQQMATIEDRPERADNTGTISYASDMHRCFGVAGKIETPKCRVEDLQAFLVGEPTGNSPSDWGWLDDFIGLDAQNQVECNGGKFPSCRDCRRKRLETLGVIASSARAVNREGICRVCTDWKLVDDPRELLCFPKPKANSWPKTYICDGPVQPIAGREPELENLRFIDLSFKGMVQSAKYAFYHCSQSRKDYCWSKYACRGYLRTCGISEKHADEIFLAAAEAKNLDPSEISYDSNESIGSFKFPAAWTGSLSLKLYIEAIMHQLFLGIADSLLELASKWASLKESGGISSNAAF